MNVSYAILYDIIMEMVILFHYVEIRTLFMFTSLTNDDLNSFSNNYATCTGSFVI